LEKVTENETVKALNYVGCRKNITPQVQIEEIKDKDGR
jgi:hypothetical protein